jgi:hypothetical protein
MTTAEKESLENCRHRFGEWEQMTGGVLGGLIKRYHYSMEHIVKTSLVRAAKELLEIERWNVQARSKGELRGFSVEKEAQARKKFENYYCLVADTNLITAKEYGPYFKIAEEELAKDEAAKKAEQERRGKPVCGGCGG